MVMCDTKYYTENYKKKWILSMIWGEISVETGFFASYEWKS